MSVRDTLSKLEKLIASAAHLPLTGKVIVDEDALENVTIEFRNEFPKELEQAEEVLRERDNILKAAQQEADDITKQARIKAEKSVDENDIVVKAREKALQTRDQTQKQCNEMIELANLQAQQIRAESERYAAQLKAEVENYAAQVFDQLINHVTNTFQGVQAAEAGLEQARQILQQSKLKMTSNQQPIYQPQNNQPQN